MLFASEITTNLPEDVLAEGLRRGKAVRRRRQHKRRMEKRAANV
jgi:hypothetical protein